jgi:hypothetical protein
MPRPVDNGDKYFGPLDTMHGIFRVKNYCDICSVSQNCRVEIATVCSYFS